MYIVMGVEAIMHDKIIAYNSMHERPNEVKYTARKTHII